MKIITEIHDAAQAERYNRENKDKNRQLEINARENIQYVEVVDIQISFWSMVVLMVKASIAAIPAAIILWILYSMIFLGIAPKLFSS